MVRKFIGIFALSLSFIPLAIGDERETISILKSDQIDVAKTAFKAASTNQWNLAIASSRLLENDLIHALIDWLAMSESKGSFESPELISFIHKHPDWPGLSQLRKTIEQNIQTTLTSKDIILWFETYPPITGIGQLRYSEALFLVGKNDLAQTVLRQAWRESNFSKQDEEYIYRRYKNLIRNEDHDSRLDRLLWNRDTRAARRMLYRVSENAKKLGVARIYLIERHPDVDKAISAIPHDQVTSSGLTYDRVRWRRLANKNDRARELLHPLPKALKYGNKWWREIAYQIRLCLRDNLIDEAYTLAANNSQFETANRSEATWIAGWIALTLLNRPEEAYSHFETMHGIVSMPISLGRSAYWAGQAAKESKNPVLSTKWFTKGADFPTTFYGQLSKYSLGFDKWTFPISPGYKENEKKQFEQRELVRAVRILGEIGEEKIMRTFVVHLSKSASTPTEHSLIESLVSDYDYPQVGIASAKQAVRSGIIPIKTSYPIPEKYGEWINSVSNVEKALSLAIARQESEMDPNAISGAGARGLMQLLPHTAKAVAKELGVSFDKSLLTTDPLYNISLGTHYLSGLLDYYHGCHPLALAAYNAGPKRVNTWLKRYGDPRQSQISVVNWIESVPYAETRNYIQRVIETQEVYRILLQKPQTLSPLKTCD